MAGFDFLDTVKNNVSQQFAPEQGQANSPVAGMNPSAPTPQLPQPAPMAQNPQSVSAMMPQPQSPEIPQPTPDQGMTGSPLDNPGGISLLELLQLGTQEYMKKLLQAPQMGVQAPQGDTSGQMQ